MAVVYLDRNDTVTVYGPGTVYGGTGRERVLLADGARNVSLSPSVEEMHLSHNAAGCQFRGASGRVEVWLDGAMVAALPATGGGQEIRFADGAAALSIDPATGSVLLGGRALGTEPASIPNLPLDASRPSDSAVREPDPTPDPEPGPDPDPTPTPDPSPDPDPTPTPTPDPKPEPLSGQKGSNITDALGYGDTFDASSGAWGFDLSRLAASDADQVITIRGLGVDDTLIFSRQMLDLGLQVNRAVSNNATGYGDAFVPDGNIDIVVGTGTGNDGKGELTIHLTDVDFDLERLTTLGNYQGLNRGFHNSHDLSGGTNVDRALTVQVMTAGGPKNHGDTGFPDITWDSKPTPDPKPEPLSVQKGSNITDALAYGATFDASAGAWGIDLSRLAASDADQVITIRGLGVDDTLIFSQAFLDNGLQVNRAVSNNATGYGDAFVPDGNIDIVVGTGTGNDGKGELTIHLTGVDFDLERLATLGNYQGINRGFHYPHDLPGGTNVDRALTVQVMTADGPENYGDTGFAGITWDSEPLPPKPEPFKEETITDYPEGADSVSGSERTNTFFSFPNAGDLAGMAVIDPDGYEGDVEPGTRSPHDNLLFAWTEDGGLPSRIVNVERVEAVWKGSCTEGRFDASGIVFDNSMTTVLSSARPDTVIVLVNAASQIFAVGENVSKLIVDAPDNVVLHANGGALQVRNAAGISLHGGASAADRVLVDDSCRNVMVGSTVEEIHFSGKAASYEFIQEGAGLLVSRQGVRLAAIAASENGQMLCFADGAAAFIQDPDTGALVVGGEFATMDVPLQGQDIALDTGRVSEIGVALAGGADVDPFAA